MVSADPPEKTFGSGVRPDIECSLQREVKLSLFTAAQSLGVRPLVIEVERPRLNEAALVAGKNPELEQGLPGSEVSPEPEFEHDRVIQSALDVIAASLRLEQS